MRNYTLNGTRKNSFANARSKNKVKRIVGRSGIYAIRHPSDALRAIGAIENIVRNYGRASKRRVRSRALVPGIRKRPQPIVEEPTLKRRAQPLFNWRELLSKKMKLD